MKKILLVLSLMIVSFVDAFSCTSFIISGRVTADGRPKMFKNRDTSDLDNLSICFRGEKFTFVGITAAADKKVENIWAGHNEVGFAIMNTAAFNLNEKDGPVELEGVVMRRALEICETLEDFEAYLDTLSRPMRVDANFGVIDANGGCAYYEVGHQKYVKFDCNDQRVAPYGYMIRTNNAYTGDHTKDIGVERYLAINDIMTRAEMYGFGTAPQLLDQASRYLVNGLTEIDLYDFMPENDKTPRFMPITDYITRYSTSSAILIEGVKKGESPLLTTSWTIVGNPYSTIAVPVWLTPNRELPEVLTKGKDGSSSLCVAGLELKKELFPLKRGNTRSYINVAALINKEGTGILQTLESLEKNVVTKGMQVLDEARKQNKVTKEMEDYYEWVDKEVKEFYKERFGLNL